MTAKAKQILQWLEHGLDIQWVALDADCQQTHPRYNKKVQLVRKLYNTLWATGGRASSARH